MGVRDATLAELQRLGINHGDDSCEAEVALTLAAMLDGDKKTVNGGEAGIAKQYLATMETIRDRHKPQQQTALTLLRGDGVA